MPGEFEQRARALLEDSVLRVDGRIRSGLNQARHAAVEEASRRPSVWRRFTLMPAASAVAAAVLLRSCCGHTLTQAIRRGGRPGIEDLDLLADGDALDLVSDERQIPGSFTNGRWIKRIRTRRAAPVPERGIRLLLALTAFAFLCDIAVAEDPKKEDPATDADLLEFLGSVDSGADSQAAADDGSWIDYLAQTDIGKVREGGRSETTPRGSSPRRDRSLLRPEIKKMTKGSSVVLVVLLAAATPSFAQTASVAANAYTSACPGHPRRAVVQPVL